MSSTFPNHLFDPPDSATLPTPRTLSADETTKIERLIEHFNTPELTLAVKEDAEGKEKLSEREMMYLVRSHSFHIEIYAEPAVARDLDPVSWRPMPWGLG